MITKFLYETDEKGRKTINGVVEKKDDAYDIKFFPMQNMNSYKSSELETVTYNKGEQFYCYFKTPNGNMYLDINSFKDEVKVQLSNNVNHAASFSKEFILVILYNNDYFGLDDVIFVSSGYFITNKGLLKDNYENFFQKAADQGYIQVKKDGASYFVAKNDKDEYFLVNELRKASRIHKNISRKVVVINEFINRDTERKALSFSEFDVLAAEKEYYFAGIRLNFDNDVLSIIEDSFLTYDTDRLIASEEVYQTMKDIFFAIKEPKNKGSYIVEIDNRFVKYENNKFEFVNDSKLATVLDSSKVLVVEEGLRLFKPSFTINKYSADCAYLHQIDKNNYILGETNNDYISVKPVNKETYDKFNEIFANFSMKNEGSILLSDNNYLQIEFKSIKEFSINWLDSSLNATILTDEELAVLIEVLRLKVQKREIKNIINNEFLKKSNIESSNEVFNMAKEYQKFMNLILEKNHRIQSYTDLDSIRTETEKGTLEYLRRFFAKNILDSEELFEEIFDKKVINNVLIVGSGCNLDIIALNNICQKLNLNINLYTIETAKWGYFPKVTLSKNINYKAAYRCGFSNITLNLINNIDLILFSRHFKEEGEPLNKIFDAILALDKDFVFANTKMCNLNKFNDSFHEYFKAKLNVRRKYFTHTEEDFKEVLNISHKTTQGIQKIYHNSGGFSLPVIDKQFSYQSIIVKSDKQLNDFFPKTTK